LEDNKKKRRKAGGGGEKGSTSRVAIRKISEKRRRARKPPPSRNLLTALTASNLKERRGPRLKLTQTTEKEKLVVREGKIGGCQQSSASEIELGEFWLLLPGSSSNS